MSTNKELLDKIRVLLQDNSVAEKTLSYMEQQKLLHKNAYKPWTEEDDKKLIELHKNHIKALSIVFERNEGAIRSRLNKLLDK